MSLLDVGNAVVLVRPEVAATDEDGNPVRVPSSVPVPVRCLVEPLTADEPLVTGQAVATVYRVLARTWPPGAFSTVEWDGRTWDVIGEPQRHRGSPATSHTTVVIRTQTPQGLS